MAETPRKSGHVAGSIVRDAAGATNRPAGNVPAWRPMQAGWCCQETASRS